MVAYYLPMATDEDDKVFKALADPSRRELLDRLRRKSGQTLGELCEDHDMSRQAVTKHLNLLEEANLVASVERGREKLHYLNPVPINEIYMRWIGKFEQDRVQALHNRKHALQDKDQFPKPKQRPNSSSPPTSPARRSRGGSPANPRNSP